MRNGLQQYARLDNNNNNRQGRPACGPSPVLFLFGEEVICPNLTRHQTDTRVKKNTQQTTSSALTFVRLYFVLLSESVLRRSPIHPDEPTSIFIIELRSRNKDSPVLVLFFVFFRVIFDAADGACTHRFVPYLHNIYEE